MSVYVVDASIAAKWFFDENLSGAARGVLNQEHRLFAPDFFLLEMDSVFCKRIRRGEIVAADGDDARVMLRQLPVEYYAFAPLQNKAYDIAKQTGQSVYDCLYVALAFLLDGQVVTADRRLYKALADSSFAGHTVWVEDIT